MGGDEIYINSLDMGTFNALLKDAAALLRQEPVRCADCAHCQPLNDRGDFYCEKLDTDFYAPAYSAETFYCADGVRRKDGEE